MNQEQIFRFGSKTVRRASGAAAALSVSAAAFASNDKVNERISGCGGRSEWRFQRAGQLERFGKRPQASWVIVSHANNHLLPLRGSASVKAHYHLKMSSQTLWAKGRPGPSQFSHRRHGSAHAHARSCPWSGCRGAREGGSRWCCGQLKSLGEVLCRRRSDELRKFET